MDARLILSLLLRASSAAAAFDHAHLRFKEDFEPRDQYFLKYAGILGLPPGASPPLAFLDYDWSLNDFRSSSPR